MIYDTYKCTVCNYTQKIPENFLVKMCFYYRLPLGFLITAGSELVWCESCRRLQYAETLDTNKFIDHENSLILYEQTLLQDHKKSIFERTKEVIKYRRGIYGTRKIARLIKMRKHPKCLICGTSTIKKVDLTKDFPHQSCRGTVKYERYNDGIYWDYDTKLVERFYSADGVFLFEHKPR